MSAETAEKCFVCVALRAPVENASLAPENHSHRESELFMRGYMAGIIHALSTKDPASLANASLDGVCHAHSLRMIEHTTRLFNALAKPEAP